MLCRYLDRISRQWLQAMGSRGHLLDSHTVSLLEGRIPSLPSDKEYIKSLFDSGKMFPLATRAEKRVIYNGLLKVNDRLLSLRTLVKDTLLLEKPAKAICNLYPRSKESHEKEMRHHWLAAQSDKPGLVIEISEGEFDLMPNLPPSFSICQAQLWLFSIRHFSRKSQEPRNINQNFGWSAETLSLVKLAILAHRLGFVSKEIDNLRSRTTGLSMGVTAGFVASLRDENYGAVTDKSKESLCMHIEDAMKNLQAFRSSAKMTSTTNQKGRGAVRKLNGPTFTNLEDCTDQLFYPIFSAADDLTGCYPTMFGIIKSILTTFLPAVSIDQSVRDGVNSVSAAEDDVQPGPQPLANVVDEALDDVQPGPQPPADEALDDENIPGDDLQPEPQPEGAPAINDGPLDSESIPEDDDQRATQPEGTFSTEPEKAADEATSNLEGQYSPSLYSVHPATDQLQSTGQESLTQVPGFESFPVKESDIGDHPLEISTKLKVTEILDVWYKESLGHGPVILFLFETRQYFKLSPERIPALTNIIHNLVKKHILYTVGDVIPFSSVDINDAKTTALRDRILLVCAKNSPQKSKADKELTLTPKELEIYLTKYNVRTGKRYRDGSSKDHPQKRSKWKAGGG